jgi:hypothetical protein
MRCCTMVLAVAAVTFGAFALAEPPVKHDFARLQRLSAALDNFNYPEQGTSRITVWLQGGGKGTSATSDREVLDLTTAVKMWTEDSIKDVDLANVAVLRADGRAVEFVDIQEFVKSDKPAGITVKRGDLVALLVR